jgi:sulfoxide reductase heme-binding subunit YedZ
MEEHVFWIASRAAGIVALLTASAAVGLGLAQGLRRNRRASAPEAAPSQLSTLLRAPDLKSAHEALSLATIVAIVLHAAALLGDGFLHPSVADLTIPFLSGYQRLWTTLGIVSGWALIALGLSYYVRGRIGVARWRIVHRFTALAWLAALVHSIGEGTDAGQAWFLAAVGIAVAPPLVLLVRQWARRRSASLQRKGVPA